MKLFRLILFSLMLLFSLNVVSAVDFDNISFTNQTFLSDAITVSDVIEINSGDNWAVGYVNATDFYLRVCDNDGTNCIDKNPGINPGSVNSISMFQDNVTGIIHAILGSTGFLRHVTYNSSGTFLGQAFPQSATASFVSSAQTNSSHLAISFQDVGDSSHGKLIICRLDRVSCDTEINLVTVAVLDTLVIKNSENNLSVLYQRNDGSPATFLRLRDLGGGFIASNTIFSGSKSNFDMIEGSDNKLKIVYRDGADNNGKFISTDLDGTNPSSVVSYSSSNWLGNSLVEVDERLFTVGREAGGSNSGQLYNFNLTGGDISTVSNFYTAGDTNNQNMIFTTNSQLVVSFRGVSNFGIFAISEVFVSGATVTINNPIEAEYLNNLSFTLNVTTDLTTNLTYSLNGASNVSLCTNCNTSVSTITGIEGSNNITVYSNLSGAITDSGLRTWTIDTINPSLTVSLPTEFNAYLGFNFSTYINFSDTNLDTCTVTISGESSTTCNQTNYNFTINGNHTINITVTDLAGNTNSSLNNIMLINPYQRFHFDDGSGLVSDFIFGGQAFSGTEANFTTFNDILSFGSNTLLFEKLGYVSQNFTFTINTTSDINVTLNVTAAQIIVNIFNRLDGSVLSGRNVTINILGLGNQTTTTGQSIFQNFSFVAADYHLEALSAGFYTAEKDFTYSGESNSIINIYLLNETQENTASLFVNVLDEFFNIIQDADTRLLEYDPSIFGFKEVSQCKTNSNGECKFLVEVGTKTYITTTSKTIGGVLFSAASSTDGEIFLPDISGGSEVLGVEIVQQLFLELSSTLPNPAALGLTITAPDNVSATIVSENSTVTVINIPVEFTASNGLAYTVCLELYRVGGNSFFEVISPICLTGSSGILPVANINLNNAFDYEARITIEFDGVKTTYQTYSYPSDTSLVTMLTEKGYLKSSILFLWVIILSIALYLRSVSLWVYGAWTLSVVQISLFPNALAASTGVVIILINIGVLYISKKMVDAT